MPCTEARLPVKRGLYPLYDATECCVLGLQHHAFI